MPSAVDRSLSVFPAGCNGEFNLPPRLAKVIARGKGAELWTTDGERMLDFSMGWGSALPGACSSGHRRGGQVVKLRSGRTSPT